MNENLKRLENESNDQYFYRVCQMKDSLGFTWPQMAEVFNEEFGRNIGDTAYRKRWAAYKSVFEANAEKIIGDNVYSDELQSQMDNLYKAKKQLSDQRREYNKMLTKDARAEHLMEKMIEAANVVPLKDYGDCLVYSKKHLHKAAVLVCSDWHYGQVSHNIWNSYNVDTCMQRISKLFQSAVDAIQHHDIGVLHIVLLGDLINGGIHTSSRVASEENTCDQLMNVSEILANFINKISKYVAKVNVYSTYGNHARSIQKKEDSIYADNMEKIVPWWLKQRLKDNDKVNIVDSEYHEFVYFNVCGYNVVCTHGDLDKLKDIGVTINSLFSKKYGKTIDYTFSGDKHHLEAFEQFGIESALVGSLCGTDEYANTKRLYSNPMQTLCIFTPEDGKLCTYNIKL